MSTSRRSRYRQAEQEEHENHERWLVTYADMVTLLMVLFIVLFAMSQIDAAKFNALKSSVQIGFGSPSPLSNQANSPTHTSDGSTAADSIVPHDIGVAKPQPQQVVDAIRKHDAEAQQRRYAEARSEVNRLRRIERRIHEVLRSRHLEGDVVTRIDARGLTVSLVSQHVVFAPNLATLSTRGRLVIDTIAPVLRDLTDPIQVDGHTNQQGATPKYYATDWDLASARAITVLRRLNEVHRLSENRLTASSFGHTAPLVDPAKPGSQKLNKRVDLVVLADLPDSTRALMDEAAAEAAQEGN